MGRNISFLLFTFSYLSSLLIDFASHGRTWTCCGDELQTKSAAMLPLSASALLRIVLSKNTKNYVHNRSEKSVNVTDETL